MYSLARFSACITYIGQTPRFHFDSVNITLHSFGPTKKKQRKIAWFSCIAAIAKCCLCVRTWIMVGDGGRFVNLNVYMILSLGWWVGRSVGSLIYTDNTGLLRPAVGWKWNFASPWLSTILRVLMSWLAHKIVIVQEANSGTLICHYTLVLYAKKISFRARIIPNSYFLSDGIRSSSALWWNGHNKNPNFIGSTKGIARPHIRVTQTTIFEPLQFHQMVLSS